MASDLAHRFLRVTEAAAIAAGRTVGQGERKHSDAVAVEAMRTMLQGISMRGRIVIGEGERDEAPMLYIGEELGHWSAGEPRVDIAVDPLEGTNLCAQGIPGSLAVLAAAEEGGLLHAPDCYMDKIVVGPRCRGAVSLDRPVEENLAAIAKRLDREVPDLLVVILDRPRHKELIARVRAAGARIRLIPDGDLSPALSACVAGSGVHAVLGIGGAPEGVLSAVAVRCLGGQMEGRLVVADPEDRARAAAMGIKDFDRILTETDLAPGERLAFVATGVTSGELLRPVTFFGGGCRTHSLVMGLETPRRIRFVDTIHASDPARLDLRL